MINLRSADMKCPVCGAVELIHETRDISYVYKEQHTIIPDVTGEFCSACQEVVLDREQGDRYSALIGVFQRKINESYIA
jgi:HTH-type transcriptional regulator/antitoxin MqsA